MSEISLNLPPRAEQSFTGASLFPDTAAVTADILHKVLLASLKHFLPGARCKFYLRPAPKPWEEITFEILKGTLRACLYGTFDIKHRSAPSQT